MMCLQPIKKTMALIWGNKLSLWRSFFSEHLDKFGVNQVYPRGEYFLARAIITAMMTHKVVRSQLNRRQVSGKIDHFSSPFRGTCMMVHMMGDLKTRVLNISGRDTLTSTHEIDIDEIDFHVSSWLVPEIEWASLWKCSVHPFPISRCYYWQ